MHTASLPLFESTSQVGVREDLAAGACVLRGFALAHAQCLLVEIRRIEAQAPFRHLVTPGGKRMSVAMTNCGTLGWCSDRDGYRYTRIDPASGSAWPPLPASFERLAGAAARSAGFDNYAPQVCLINQYAPGARLTLHRDQDERDRYAPIVSVSLGLSAVFLFGGQVRNERPRHVPLVHGDVVVWGGPARMRFHGVLPIDAGEHPLTGALRYNLTFRVVG